MNEERPKSVADAMRAVSAAKKIHIRGAATKNGVLPPADSGSLVIDTRSLSGVVEYEPTEFTITAQAGTTLSQLENLLAAEGQYLPFDPPFVSLGATLGGTVSAGLSGPGRLRYGGVRDFILGIRFIDGVGKMIRGGGKVVKNSAGFDLPKLFVGSCGWLGLLTEVTLKVFPLSVTKRTLGFNLADSGALVRALERLTTQPFELDALDFVPRGSLSPEPSNTLGTLLVRMAGEPAAIEAHLDKLAETLALQPQSLSNEESAEIWQSLSIASWCADDCDLVKVPLTLRELETLVAWCQQTGVEFRLSVAGQLLWLAWPSRLPIATLADQLQQLQLGGLLVRRALHESQTPRSSCRLGKTNGQQFWSHVKQSLDPENKFGDWLP